jgi:hypothetical protein
MIPLNWRLLDASGNSIINLNSAIVAQIADPYICPIYCSSGFN